LDTKDHTESQALGRRVEVQRLLCELSNEFINLPGDRIHSHINQALGRMAQFLGFNLAAIGKLTGRGSEGLITHIWTAPEIPPIPPGFTQADFPWVAERLVRSEIVHLPGMESLPPEAKRDRQTYDALNIQSVYNWPLSAGNGVIGCLGLASIGRKHGLPGEFQEGIQLFIEILANALAKECAAAGMKEALAFERLLSNLSSRLLRSSTTEVDADINQGLRELAEFFDVDRCTLWERFADGAHFNKACSYVRSQTQDAVPSLALDDFPWLVAELNAGRTVRIERPADYPAAAEKERRYWDEQQIKSALILPLTVGGRLAGCCSFLTMRAERSWPDALAQRLRLAGEVFAHVLERRRAWEQLQETNERFRTVADSAPVMIWMSGTDKLCHFFNKPWLEFTGRPLEQEVGNGWTEGVHPADLEGCLKIYVEAFDVRKPFVMQYRLRRHDGKYRWITDHGVPRYDARGNFAGYVGSCVDFTERRQANEKFRLAVEASPEAIIMVNDRGEMVLANAQTERVFGYKREELIGQSIEMLVPERHRGAHPGHRGNFFAAPETRAMGAGRELFARRKDGTEFPVEIGLNPIESEEGLFVLSAIVDITERRRSEMERQRLSHELAHAGRVSTLGQLASALAHELSQPLGAILRNTEAAELFLRGLSPDLEEVRAILVDIQKDDRRAAAIIEQMRSLLKRREPEWSLLKLAELVNEVAAIVRPDAVNRKVLLEVDVPGTLPAVRGDRVQLQQVLLNLILNGMDAMSEMPPGTRRIRISGRLADTRNIEMAVADSGHGVSEERFSKLFEPFHTTKPQGMGLGLSICRTIISAHGGRIWAENRAGGATFFFTVPVCSEVKRG
jgi:two-component system sensor kinase FixL